MGMILIDPSLLEDMEKSSCFGIAHSTQARECKMCDAQQECAAKSASNKMFDPVKQLKPETEKAIKSVMDKKKDAAEPTVKPPKGSKPKVVTPLPAGMPEMKGMSTDKLWELLKERGGTCKEFPNPNIQKMRLIMAIKETYK